jgi:ATP-dependent Clp protease protease subunit
MNNNEFDKFALMHQGINSTTLNRYRTELFSIIAQHSGQTYENVAADGERNFWMTAQEALEYGMVDQILTKKK